MDFRHGAPVGKVAANEGAENWDDILQQLGSWAEKVSHFADAIKWGRYRPLFWALNNDDKRNLFVAFVSGMAAILGAGLVAALGLLEAHLIHKYSHHLPAGGGWLLVVEMLAAPIGLSLFFWAVPATLTIGSRRLLFASIALLSLIGLLALIGFTAGIS
jgi:hypothetical protein